MSKDLDFLVSSLKKGDIVGYLEKGKIGRKVGLSTLWTTTHVGIVVSTEPLELVHSTPNVHSNNFSQFHLPSIQKESLESFLDKANRNYISCVRVLENTKNVVELAKQLCEYSEEQKVKLKSLIESLNGKPSLQRSKYRGFMRENDMYVFNYLYDSYVYPKSIMFEEDDFTNLENVCNKLMISSDSISIFLKDKISPTFYQNLCENYDWKNIDQELNKVIENCDLSVEPCFVKILFNHQELDNLIKKTKNYHPNLKNYFNRMLIEIAYRGEIRRCFSRSKSTEKSDGNDVYLYRRFSCCEFIQFIFGMNGIWFNETKPKRLNLAPWKIPSWTITPKDIILSPKIVNLKTKQKIFPKILNNVLSWI